MCFFLVLAGRTGCFFADIPLAFLASERQVGTRTGFVSTEKYTQDLGHVRQDRQPGRQFTGNHAVCCNSAGVR